MNRGSDGQVPADLELRTLQDVFRRFENAGDTTAILSHANGAIQSLTYAELARQARRIANHLGHRGFDSRIPIGLIAANSPEWVSGFFGAIAAGAIVMPLDAQCSDHDLAHMLTTSGCQLALTAPKSAERVRALVPSCETIVIEEVLTPGSVSEEHESQTCSLSTPDANSTAVLLFTSGTTGTPKAVPLTHANILSNVQALLAEGLIRPGDRGLVPLPLHHAYPLTVGMLTMLASGATLVLPSGISGPELTQAIQRGRVTLLLGVPRLYEAIFAGLSQAIARRSRIAAWTFFFMLAFSRLARRRLCMPAGRILFRHLRRRLGAELRFMVSGGAAIAPEIEESLDALGWEMLTGYGLTETSPILSFNRRGEARPGSAGRALLGVELRIWQPDAGGVGEIQARGSSVFAGYLNDPSATKAAFTADGWFKTGDLGRLDRQGYLTVVGRLKDTIVLPDGKKLLLETVEAAYATIPLLREIAIMPRGSGLAALVVPDFEAIRAAGATRLEELIRDTLEAHARTLPSHYRLTGVAISREPLPRTPLGKIRRGQLAALYERAHESRQGRALGKPDAADEAILAHPIARSVWQWLQARYKERQLDLDTSPQLDLAIDSLGWIDFTLALQHDLGIALTEKEIARIVTLRDLLAQAIAVSGKEKEEATLGAGEFRWLAPLGPFPLAARAIGEFFLRLFLRRAFSLRVEGVENLPAEGPFLLCPNHTSYLDAFALGAALPHRHLRNTYWAGWQGILFHTPLRRLFSRIARVIPVDPDRALMSNIALSAAVLGRGFNLVWFPEGSLSPDGSLQEFLPGVGVLLERKPVPVVPVLIAGSREAWPPTKPYPRFHPVSVRFGPPIDAVAAALPPGERHQQMADAIRRALAGLQR